MHMRTTEVTTFVFETALQKRVTLQLLDLAKVLKPVDRKEIAALAAVLRKTKVNKVIALTTLHADKLYRWLGVCVDESTSLHVNGCLLCEKQPKTETRNTKVIPRYNSYDDQCAIETNG